MIAKRSPERIPFSFTVAGGTGSFQFQKVGHIRILHVRPPTQESGFDYEITDSDGYGLTGKSAQKGPTTVALDTPVATLCTLTLNNAANGLYKGVIYMDQGA